MKNLFTLLAFALLLPAALSAQSTDEQAVITKFETALKHHIDSYVKNPRTRITKLGGGWVKEKFVPEKDYKYDVQKANSLITPYTGYCIFNLKRTFTAFHDTREEAERDTIFTQKVVTTHKHIYAYKKGKWTVTKRDHQSFESDWYDCNEIVHKGTAEEESNLEGCWEEELSYE